MNSSNYWNSKTKDITLMGIYLGLFMMIGFIPQFGLIYIPPIYLTTFPILMLMIIFIHQKFKYALFAGLAFGFTSLLLAAVRPVGSKDWLYLNPLISILPRVLWAMLVYWLLMIGPKRWMQVVWLIFVIFVTYWVHALVSDFFKFMFYVWAAGYDWHNNNLLYSLGILWAPEHLIEVAIYCVVSPLVIIKSTRTIKGQKTDRKLAIFDFSRMIAFGEGKERTIPENIGIHLRKLTETHEVVVITGRHFSKVNEELSKYGIRNIASKHGSRIYLDGNEYVGYTSKIISAKYSRLMAIKLIESIFHSKVDFIVSDNKTESTWIESGKLFTAESHHKKLDGMPIYNFN